MTRVPKSDPLGKGRVQQKLAKQIAKEAAAAIRAAPKTQRNPAARHQWLVRHVERQQGRCAYCHIPIWLSPQHGKADCRASLDHVVPLARNGADSEANTVAACEACNSAKADRSAQLYGLDPFCVARRQYGESLPVRAPVKLEVTRKRVKRRLP